MSPERITITRDGLSGWLHRSLSVYPEHVARLVDELVILAASESTGTPAAEADPLVDPARVHRFLAEEAIRGEAARFAMVSPAVADRLVDAARPHLDAILAELDLARRAITRLVDVSKVSIGDPLLRGAVDRAATFAAD